MQPFIPPKKIDKAGLIAMRKAQALAAASASTSTDVKPEDAILARAQDFIKPEDAPERLRIIFDNSGSMSGQKMSAAKEGVIEFLRNCTPNATAVAVHLLNNEPVRIWREDAMELPPLIKDQTLTSDLLMLASELKSDAIGALGGTPLYSTLLRALDAIPLATRIIAFSDGAPSFDGRSKDNAITFAKEYKIPIDTVYIDAYDNSMAIALLQELAEATGGYFLNLSKGDFKKGIKYLAPTKRLMLADSSFKEKVERGAV